MVDPEGSLDTLDPMLRGPSYGSGHISTPRFRNNNSAHSRGRDSRSHPPLQMLFEELNVEALQMFLSASS